MPFPEGSVGEGLTSHTVWAAASGLAPGTTYHYRVVATNELGPAGVVGEDQTFTTETAAQAACPNERSAAGSPAVLPDCRAYELVTPRDQDLRADRRRRASCRRQRVRVSTHEPLPGAPTGGNSYVATRGAGGWSSEDMIPLESYTGAILRLAFQRSGRRISDDMSTGAHRIWCGRVARPTPAPDGSPGMQLGRFAGGAGGTGRLRKLAVAR